MRSTLFLLAVLGSTSCARTRASGGSSADAAPVSLDVSADAARTEEPKPMDLATEDRVRDAILADRALEPTSGAIRVEAREGILTLDGFVPTAELKQRARTLVNSVGGVVRVEDRLVVDAARSRTDEILESSQARATSHRVRQALAEDRTVGSEAVRLEIRTKEGVVRIRGSVSSSAVKHRVGVVASAVGGVVRVDDQLVVGAR